MASEGGLTRAARAAIAVGCALCLAGCAATVRVRVLAPGEDCARDFGSSTAAAKIETYLAASSALVLEAGELGVDLDEACGRGLAIAREGAAATSDDEASPCDALATWVATEREALPLGPSLGVHADAVCDASEGDFAECVSRCELRYRPEDVRIVRDEEGLLTAPNVSPRCRASCGTTSAIETSCSPRLRVEPGEVTDTERSRAQRLTRALEQAAVAIDLGERARRLSLAAERLVTIAPVLPEAAATVSIRAVACVQAASEPVRTAAARLESAHDRTGALRRRMRPDVQLR